MSNLAIVFFFEFTITTALIAAAIYKICNDDTDPRCVQGSGSFLYAQAFLIIFYCYQIGVFISRSSLEFFVIDEIWVVTTIQGINFLFFLLNGLFLFCSSIIVIGIIMIWVGLQGGTVYVNLLYKISRSTKFEPTEKELSIFILLIFHDVGVFFASVTSLVLTLTVFRQT